MHGHDFRNDADVSERIRMAYKVTAFRATVIALSAGLSLQVGRAEQQYSGVDPPAITVFPQHDTIGTADYTLEQAIADGKKLFKAKFNLADGAGRPESTGDSKPTPRTSAGVMFQRIAGPDANSCAGCHNEPAVGGSGEFVANTFVGAHLSDPPSPSMAAEVTNERNTVTLFGTGVVELVAREMTQELHERRDAAVRQARATGLPVQAEMLGKTTRFGTITAHPNGYVDYAQLDGLDYTLIVRPFGVKGIAASLREFTTFALNQHHGIQPIERFGWERTGRSDFDGDGHTTEFTIGQVTAMVLFQAALPVPNLNDPVHDTGGGRTFVALGCAQCHTPRTTLRSNVFAEPGPFNRPGAMNANDAATIVRLALDVPRRGEEYEVAMYSDLKRHQMCDEDVRHFCNERIRQDNVRQELFMTMRLWDLATSAPYGHRGDCSTLSEVILAHGGEARPSREKFRALSDPDKKGLITFLLSLGATQAAAN
jgi:cytochrome c peroxidase